MIDINNMKSRINIFGYENINDDAIITLYLSANKDISIIEEFEDFFDFEYINNGHRHRHEFKEDVLEKYFNKLSIARISKYSYLSDEFIRKFSGRLDFDLLSTYCVLSNEIIDEFSDKINFAYLSYYNKITLHVAKKYIDLIKKNHVLDNPNTTKEVYDFVHEKHFKTYIQNVYNCI